ncbi:SigB/SigF/SigG family RNA polymerase sigma factor [Streptomyces sp. BR123]|uniref:SigB/SigF/SigG family RNA polymerase sigma factor n=1 Tax=Streptomyces sp. BR123 TaxID=2749828 RepID=UPI0015C4C867|nr:SigB/SigF/SigG family RNA polymerase sigma factor [Streptomyces sp. BR123]NXY93792.1 SigB/SigF/SigG family RNA polymerase sigma factor [Streptomyces sp. BR123]
MTLTATVETTAQATTTPTTTATPADGGAGAPALRGLPDVPCPSELSTSEARHLTRVFFERLRSLEEGTREYQYVRNTLIEMNISLVRFAARPFRDRPGGPENEDIVQVGIIGLIKAIDRYDPDRNTQFTTLAMPYITGEIKRHFRDTAWAVHVPRRLQEMRSQLAKAAEELTAVLGHEPTSAELAAHLDLPEDEVRDGLVAANGYSTQSLDAPQESTAPGTQAPAPGRAPRTFAETLGDVDPALEAVEDWQALALLLADLDERCTRILQLRFGEGMTQAAIGAEIGLSQMHVSRLLSRTLDALRRELLHG